MNKLNKPRAFEASPSSINVIFGAQEVECTNLTRSAIMVQTVVLVANEGKWHEVEIADLGLDSVHLPTFKHHIESNGLKLSDIGLEAESIDHELKHVDFEELEAKYPKYQYFQISKLYEYQKKYGIPNSKKDIEKTLEMISQHYLDIDAYIESLEKLKESIISRPDTAYEEVVNTDKPQKEIIVEHLPAPEVKVMPADSVSLQIFEKLTPEKITELQGLRITQEEIVKANPVVIIKDKKTYAEAKKVAAILLSASTTIDGTKGVEATATKYLNTFKTMLKTALAPISKLTREPYDKQKKLIEDWDNRLLLQVQNRVKELFAVPFTYNSSNDSYNVGSLIIIQKDIEDKTDTEFSSLVAQGKEIIIALESVKSEQDSKIAQQEKQIEELKAMIEQLLPKKEEVSNVVSGTSFEPVTEASGNPSEPVLDNQNSVHDEEKEEKQYSLPNPNNKLLNELDLAHISVLGEKQYIECREYYAQALQDAADSINDILINPDKTIQKSVAITELIKTWKL